MRTYSKAMVLLGSLLASCSTNQTADQQEKSPAVEHVVVIGVDGMSPDGIRKAQTPVLDSLIQNGAVSWKVRTVLPSASSQNWASMIMGAGPEIHGITSNDWKLNQPHLAPVIAAKDGRFPTIFTILKEQKPEATIGIVHHWGDFGRLYDASIVDYTQHFSTEDSSAVQFAAHLVEKQPTLSFLHLDHVDHAGHHDGHGSDSYYASIAKTDSLVRLVVNAINKTDMANKTTIFIISDHGGLNKGHGGETLAEAEVALIVSGAGAKKGYEVKHPVYMYDLASSIAFALNVKQPYAWTGRATKAAFEGFNEP